LQQHCGKLEGERQVLKERLAEFEDGLNKCKAQSQEFAAKLAQSRKSEGSVRSELEKSKDELESTKRDLNDRIDKVARLSAELEKIKRHLSSGSTSKLELAPIEVAVERAPAVSEPAAAPSAESTNILGALANGLSAEAQKRVLSKLVMATRKVYRGSSSAKTTDESGSQVKENIHP
jgi:chromosome segregation ATPase